MKYCPYCAEELTQPVKVCPNCKKLLDVDFIKEIYESGKGSQMNKKLLKRKWLKEHAHIIIPVVTLIVGVVVGGLLSYTYAQQAFASERRDYRNQISELQMTIASRDSVIANSSQGFQEQLASKDEIIEILSGQRRILIQVVNFTRRLSNNSIVTPNTADEADYYKRNILYLNNQFQNEQERLIETGYTSDGAENLVTVPQMIE